MAAVLVHDPEKSQTTHLEWSASEDTRSNDYDARINAFTPEERKKIIRKVDLRLVSILGLMYCVSLMDRTNLGIAVVAGMDVDLRLSVGARYSLITLVFFFTYVFLQPPATVVLRKVGPRVFLPSITILWGITMICFAFVKNWAELIPLRLILGIFEAGFFPGAAYLLSCFYPRHELQKRNAVFYLIGSMSSAFSGILAYGFSQMNGLGNLGSSVYGQHYGPQYDPRPAAKGKPSGILPGISGWRWIFIMQGLITVIVGGIGLFLIVDFPEKAATSSRSLATKFLTEKEADFICARVDKDRADVEPEPFNLRSYLSNAADAKVWGFAALFGLTTTVTYAIAFFLPIILRVGMGFNTAESQCLIAPPYAAAAIVMYAAAWAGDKYKVRGPIIISLALLGILGLGLMGFATNVGARYTGVFFATISANANVPAILTFQANNIRGQWKRAFCSATLVGMGGVGGIVGSTVFRSQDSPAYRPGMYTCLIASALIVVITAFMDLGFARANKKAANGTKIIEGLASFRYTI